MSKLGRKKKTEAEIYAEVEETAPASVPAPATTNYTDKARILELEAKLAESEAKAALATQVIVEPRMAAVEKKSVNMRCPKPLYLQLKKKAKDLGYKSVNMYCLDIISKAEI